MKSSIRIAALLSGGGRTLMNLIDRIDDVRLPARIDTVISSRDDAPGVERARARGFKVHIAQDGDVSSLLDPDRHDLVCLCGWLRHLRIEPWMHGRVMNIHPSLLPAFGGKGMYGHRVHAAVIDAGLVKRDDLFLQTKYTFQRGQDHRLPYDPEAPIATQVAQSFTSSLEHLNTNWIDSYVLHGPTQREGLADDDWEAWRAMEELHAAGQIQMLGISNTSLEQLQALCAEATVRPTFVQNRCYAARHWDRDIREFCHEQQIAYQGFSLLTANRKALSSPQLAQIAMKHGCTIAQLIFSFALEVGMIPLTGTTSAEHMQGDLRVFDLHLTTEEITFIENCGVG